MRRREWLMGAGLGLSALALAGCSTVPAGGATGASGGASSGASSGASGRAPGDADALADAPRLSGRFGLVVPPGVGSPKGQSVNANFELLGDPRQGRLEMSTPMGSLVARVSWKPGLAWVRTPEGERSYDDINALTEELLGEALPLQALFDWLRGRPWPQAAHRQAGAQSFEQLGWQVDLRRFPEQLIAAQRLDPRGGEPLATLRLKLDASP